MSQIKIYMTPDPVTMKIDMSLEAVEELFIKKRITVVPVVDNWFQVLGVVSDFSLVKMFLKRASLKNKDTNIGNFLDYLEPVVLIDENQPMIAAFKLMMQSPNHRVFATRQGKLSGVLSPKDMLPFLVGEKKHHKSAHEEHLELEKKIQELAAELSHSRKQLISYQNFFNDSPFMMHSASFEGIILMANKIMHYTLGYNPGELVGEPLSKIYSHQNHQDAEKGLERIKNFGFHPPVSTLMVKKNSETIKVDVASMAKRDEEDQPIGTITISQLTESAHMMDVLREAVFLFQEERKNSKNKQR